MTERAILTVIGVAAVTTIYIVLVVLGAAAGYDMRSWLPSCQ
jgi:threonine/homoserine/homoserine lactone efflux protein